MIKIEFYISGVDGGKSPIFQEKFLFNLIEGLREINVAVWNSNTLTFDDFIGSGKYVLSSTFLFLIMRF